jgi:hypothetical protein
MKQALTCFTLDLQSSQFEELVSSYENYYHVKQVAGGTFRAQGGWQIIHQTLKELINVAHFLKIYYHTSFQALY